MITILLLIGVVYGFVKNRKLIFRRSSETNDCIGCYLSLMEEMNTANYQRFNNIHKDFMTWRNYYQGRVPAPLLSYLEGRLRSKFLSASLRAYPKTN